MDKAKCTSDYKQFLKALGVKIRLLREQKKLSQERLSFDAGIHRTYLSDLELGNRNPSIGSLYLIAKALGVSIIDLLNTDISSLE